MASDGPSKPLVPPPPTLSSAPGPGKDGAKPAALPEDDGWLELIEDEPTAPKDTTSGEDPNEADAPSPDAPIEDEPTAPKTVEGSGDDAAEAAADDQAKAPPKLPPVDPNPLPRRGVLPPPKSEGKRVQPVHSKARPARAARPSAAGLPSGMRPPGAPESADREDTDVLIASAVAALTEGEPPDGEDAGDGGQEAVVPTVEAPVPDPVPLTPPVAASKDGSEPPTESRSRLGLWLGLGTAAAVLALVFAISGSDDDADLSGAAAVVAEAEAAAPPTPQREPVPPPEEPAAEAEAVAAAPDLPPAAAELPPDVGGGVALADALDVGGEPLEDKLDVGTAEEDVEVAVAAEEPPAADTRRGKSKRRRKQKAAATEPSRPAPAAPTAKKPDADALLADARKALAAGQARKAYSLATKSRSAKRTSAALVVMAKAACRFGAEAKAKSAFNQLSVSARRGIRSECRSHGVRLGL